MRVEGRFSFAYRAAPRYLSGLCGKPLGTTGAAPYLPPAGEVALLERLALPGLVVGQRVQARRAPVLLGEPQLAPPQDPARQQVGVVGGEEQPCAVGVGLAALEAPRQRDKEWRGMLAYRPLRIDVGARSREITPVAAPLCAP